MNSIYIVIIGFLFLASCLLMYVFYLKSEIEHLKGIGELKDMRIENLLFKYTDLDSQDIYTEYTENNGYVENSTPYDICSGDDG